MSGTGKYTAVLCPTTRPFKAQDRVTWLFAPVMLATVPCPYLKQHDSVRMTVLYLG